MHGTPHPLSAAAKRALAEIVEQLRDTERLDGLCVTQNVSTIKHAWIGTSSGPEVSVKPLEVPGDGEGHDLIPVLSGDGYDRTELRSVESRQRVRSVRRETPDDPEAPLGLIVEFNLYPPRILSATVLMPTFPGMMGRLVHPADATMRFEYVHGYPLTVETRTRIRSRGLGRLRVDQELRIDERYALCEDAGEGPLAPEAS